jgi:hypothetical protein
MGIKDLGTLDQAQRTSRAQPKPQRGDRKRSAYDREYAKHRDLIWLLDESRSRASGRRLTRGSDDLDRGGVVAHILSRGAHPEIRFDRKNSILLSIREHNDSDPRTANAGGRVLLQMRGRNADRTMTFIRRDRAGRELSRYSSTRTR